jgi:hypothetical protein
MTSENIKRIFTESGLLGRHSVPALERQIDGLVNSFLSAELAALLAVELDPLAEKYAATVEGLQQQVSKAELRAREADQKTAEADEKLTAFEQQHKIHDAPLSETLAVERRELRRVFFDAEDDAKSAQAALTRAQNDLNLRSRQHQAIKQIQAHLRAIQRPAMHEFVEFIAREAAKKQ